MCGAEGITQFGDYISPVGKICVVSDQCSLDYMEWFYMISNPFITLAQSGDTPSVPPVQQYDTFVEPDVHQQLVAAVAPDEADVNVHRPGHAVVIYFKSAAAQPREAATSTRTTPRSSDQQHHERR